MSDHGLAPQGYGDEAGGRVVIATGSPLTLDAHASARVACGASPAPPRVCRGDRGRRRRPAASSPVWCRLSELNGRIAEQRAVLDHSEPFAYAAQNLYAALIGGRCRRGDGVPLRQNPDAA